MDYAKDKVDAMVLALLWLTTLGGKRAGQIDLRAWKGHDWDALNRLHEKGFIGDPASSTTAPGASSSISSSLLFTIKRF